MRFSRPGRRVLSTFVAGALFVAIGTWAAAQPSIASFERWATTHALSLKGVEPAKDVSDLSELPRLIGTARVVALGEPAHGAHEPLAFRNRLFRYFVETQGFTAIAIESGLPESRSVNDFVNGGTGNPAQIVRDGLSYGFGAFQENVELVQWMRDYNATPDHRRVRFYGIDLSLGGPRGYTPSPVPVNDVLNYLTRVDRAAAQRLNTKLQPFLDQLPRVPFFSASEHDRFEMAILDAMSVLRQKHLAFSKATSQMEFAWAWREATVALDAERQFRAAPPSAPPGVILPGDWRPAEARNRAMADNVRWVLEQEAPSGRVLVFAHNAHIMNARMEGGIWSVFTRAPAAMGMFLRSVLGKDLVIIGTSSAANPPGLPPWTPDADNIDAALAGVGLPQFVLDLRMRQSDRAADEWLSRPRTLRANFTTSLTLAPSKAFDALVFIRTLTPSHATPAPK